MIFRVDSQLPRRLAVLLNELGHDARHTIGLPKGNETPDTEINQLSVREGRVIITKDTDFVDSHVLRGIPSKLLLVSTGNISNDKLAQLFRSHIGPITTSLENSSFVEITLEGLAIHD